MPFANIGEILESSLLNLLIALSQSLTTTNVNRWLLLAVRWRWNLVDHIEYATLIVKVSEEHTARLVWQCLLTLPLKLRKQAFVRPNVPPVQIADLLRSVNLNLHPHAFS
jgi:hypothetical protein